MADFSSLRSHPMDAEAGGLNERRLSSAGLRRSLLSSPRTPSANQRLKLTGAAILVFRASMSLQAAPAA